MEEDINFLQKRIELNKQMFVEFGRYLYLGDETVNAIENLINKNKEQEKTIELMAKGLFEYANLGVLIDCPAEYDGIIDMKFCKMNLKDRNCIVCIKEYYEKKAKEMK